LRILVTGGAGFIGGHLVERLVREGLGPVTVLDNLSRGRLANLAAVRKAVRFVKADIRDPMAVASRMRKTDVVFHLAAQSNVLGAVHDVDYSSSTNIVGTAGVLQAARAAGVRRVVFTSSREVYGDPARLPVPETAPLCPKNAYGMSKVAGEMACSMSAGHALELVILRLANVYGPRDIGRVIPLFVESAVRGRPLTLYGGRQIVDFVHVDHVVDALMRVGFGEHVARPVNVGSGKGTTIVELAERILELTNSGSRICLMPSRDVEVGRFVADTTRARTLLGLEHRDDPLHGLPDLIARAAAEARHGLPELIARAASEAQAVRQVLRGIAV
jgi:nucleoside-diphosphate-sugar epimerase